MMLAEVGNRLLITRGKYRGRVAEVMEVKHLNGGLKDYIVRLDDGDGVTLDITVPAEDLREFSPGSINLENQWDITNYISTDIMRDIAKKVYMEKLSVYFNEIMDRRVGGCGSVADQILNECAHMLSVKIFPECEEEAIKKFKAVIMSDKPFVDDEYEKPFGRSLKWKLEKVAEDWITDHKEELQSIMEDTIRKEAQELATSQLLNVVVHGIDLKTIIAMELQKQG